MTVNAVNDILTSRKAANFRRRFMVRIPRLPSKECWNWPGFTDPNGYGQVVLDGAVHKTHRVSWVLHNGPIPPSGMIRPYSIRHKCDNPTCVNPNHLFIGTDRDNALDATCKGRMAQGAEHYAAKLTEEQVAAIRTDTRPVRSIAEEFGVSKSTIYYAQRAKGWKRVVAPALDQPREKTTVRKGLTKNRLKHVTDEMIIEMRASADPLAALAVRYRISIPTVSRILKGQVGAHLPLGPRSERHRGRPPGPGYQTSPTGKLGTLRRAVEAVLASREEMDEGWFVPEAVMAKLQEAI